MNLFYHIQHLCPRVDRSLSGAGFSIQLYSNWKEAVAKSELNQETVNTAIKNLGRQWLDGCGFSAIFDPENCGFDKDPNKPPSPEAHPRYMPWSIQVSWGEWGPEHITVPGNACGLDIDKGLGAPPEGRVLLPHNVDRIGQAHLLLVVFTWIADFLVMEINERHYNERQRK
jgi:hypothetical protein